MKYFNKIMLLVFILTVSSCENNNKEELNQTLTLEEIKSLIKEYGLETNIQIVEGTNNKSSIKSQQGNNTIPEGVEPIRINRQEFIEYLEARSEYEKSEEGIKAKELSEFYILSRSENWTKKRKLDFLKSFDEKYETNLYEMHTNGSSVSTLFLSQKEID